MTVESQANRPQRPNSAAAGRTSLNRKGIASSAGTTPRANGGRYELEDGPSAAKVRSGDVGAALEGQASGGEELAIVERPVRSARLKLRHSSQVNEYTKLVERTVDNLKGDGGNGAYEDAQRILANIRKQYDEVHADAEKRESELMEIRKEVRLVEVEPQSTEALSYSNVSREDITNRLNAVINQVQESATTKTVYSHMVSRLKREVKIVEEKIKKMEDHLNRKTLEVEKKQKLSRRVHGEKVQKINELEAMETDMETERTACNAALDDLELVLQQRRNEVRRREDFERWRYEVAMEAASEAFQAMSGRFRKIYAIEKLTGNCLQKIIFEQAENSQKTEDGFQKIREVTGLSDVMDIVHKFLNRDTEHEQLLTSVREAEVRLHSLREAEMNRHDEGLGYDDADCSAPLATIYKKVDKEEQLLFKAQRDQEQHQRRLRNTTLLVDNIMQWARKITKSMGSFESEELDEIESMQDVVPFFQSLSQTIDRFFTQANEEMPPSKLSKLTSHACSKEYQEQHKLLSNKEFLRANCRVPASLDGSHVRPHSAGRHGHGHSHNQHSHRGGREQQDEEIATRAAEMTDDRDRLKREAKEFYNEKKEHQNRLAQQARRPYTACHARRNEDEHHGEHRGIHHGEHRAEDSPSHSLSPGRASASARESTNRGASADRTKHAAPKAPSRPSSRPSSRNGAAPVVPPGITRGAAAIAAAREGSNNRPTNSGRPLSSRK